MPPNIRRLRTSISNLMTAPHFYHSRKSDVTALILLIRRKIIALITPKAAPVYAQRLAKLCR
jgi:hypothetical protein